MFHQLKIRDVRPETAHAVAVTFDADGTDFAWQPGQYLTLRATVDGQDMRRSYSIASLPGQPVSVGIKHVPGGAFSAWAQGLKAGDLLQVMPPEGRFTLGQESNIVLVAAGSGITPMVSIAAAALARGARVCLIYGNRNHDSIMFRQVLDDLKDQYLDRLTLIHILSREPQDVAVLNGRITGEKLAALAAAGAVDLAGADGVFLCGPGDMIDDVCATLNGLGIDQGLVHFERFFQPGDAPRAPRSAEAAEAAEQGAIVEVVLDGARRQFSMQAGDDTVLDAAARNGLELPYSCKGGMCCTCRCKVADGQAEMAVNYSLEAWELQAGFVLACQARPTTDKLVLDFDAS